MRIKANTPLVSSGFVQYGDVVICEPLWRLVARTAAVVGAVLTAGLAVFFAGYGIWSGEGIGYGITMFAIIGLIVAMAIFDEKIERAALTQKIRTWMSEGEVKSLAGLDRWIDRWLDFTDNVGRCIHDFVRTWCPVKIKIEK